MAATSTSPIGTAMSRLFKEAISVSILHLLILQTDMLLLRILFPAIIPEVSSSQNNLERDSALEYPSRKI